MQVKKRRKEEVKLLCGWSAYHINNNEFILLNIFSHYSIGETRV